MSNTLRITVIGIGKVGLSLAKQLQYEGHDVTVIDKDEEVVNQASNTLDIIGYAGNGATLSVLRSVGIESCDLLIATTGSDEINILCCLSGHHLGAKSTIARVRNPEYAEQFYEMKNSLGLSMSLNPERATAEEIARILRFPSATRVELFARRKLEMVSCRVPEDSVLNGVRLSEMGKKFGMQVLICAVDRDGEPVIPSGEFIISSGDILYLTGAPKDIEKAFRSIGMTVAPVRSVIITGGGRISYYLAEALSHHNISTTIIESDRHRAEHLAEMLPKAVIIHGDATDHDLLREEGIDRTDAFVSLTGLDEGNILSALYAKKHNVTKVIAKVNNEHLYSLFKGGELETIVSAKSVTIGSILRYVRALAASKTDDNVLSLYRIANGRVEILEFLAKAEMNKIINIPLSDINTKENVLIAGIVRKGKVIIPSGADCILPGDTVLVSTANERMHSLSDIIKE